MYEQGFSNGSVCVQFFVNACKQYSLGFVYIHGYPFYPL